MRSPLLSADQRADAEVALPVTVWIGSQQTWNAAEVITAAEAGV